MPAMSTEGLATGKVASRVLKAPRVDGELDIAKRRSEAAELVEQARASAAQMLTRSREQGFEEGRKAVMTTLMEEVTRVAGDFAMLVRRREDALAAVVMQGVATIIGEMPPEEQARKVVSAALTELLDSFTVVLKVSAEDLQMVRDILTALQQDGRAQNVISVVVDPLLGAGEMLLETERGRIHIGLQQQLTRLRAAIQQAAQQGG